MLAQAVHGSLRQAIDRRPPGLPVVLADENVGVVVIIGMAVHRDVNPAGREAGCGNAADDQVGRDSLPAAGKIAGEVGPVPAAVTRALEGAVVGAGIEHVAVERRFGDGREGAKIS